jgi:hypothetical protein
MTFKWSTFILVITTILLMASNTTFAQSKSSTTVCKISGIVKDSVNLANLPQATIAVYKSQDNSLYKYRFNNANGRFLIDSLEINVQYHLIVSFVGYKYYKYNFSFSTTKLSIELPPILLREESTSLKEVSIGLPPILMRGDTIEFNADAFKLDSAAVVGDLMRKLPGVIIWGDGKITVNGKKVNNITVNGKTFFSGDFSVAMDNLPKNIVQKIQAIPKYENDRLTNVVQPSSYDLDLKLKKDMNAGLFGKIGVGVGSKEYYDSDIMLSYFSDKTQVSIVGGSNNINKSATDVNSMMLNSGFSQGSINRSLIEPNFGQSGQTRQNTAGLVLKNDWSKHFLSQVEFYTYNTKLSLSDNLRRTLVLPDSSITSQIDRVGGTLRTNYSTSASTKYSPDLFNTLTIDLKLNKSKYNFDYENTGSTVSSKYGILNNVRGENQVDGIKSDNNIYLDFKHKFGKKDRTSKEDFDITYHINNNVDNFKSIDVNEVDPLITGNAQYFNRNRMSQEKSNRHKFYARYYSLMNLLGIFSRTNIDLIIDGDFLSNNKRDIVRNYDPKTNEYSILSLYLTNNIRFTESTLKPTIYFSRLFDKGLSGKFYRSALVKLGLQNSIFSQKSISDKLFQNITRKYNYLLPNINLKLKNTQSKISEHNLELGYNSTITNPTILQLAPLIDSAQQVTIFRGNLNLRESFNQVIDLNYSYASLKENGIQLSASLKFELVDRYISDSIYIDNVGRQNIMPINVNGYKNYFTQINFSKPLFISRSPTTLNIFPSIEYFVRPFFNKLMIINSKNVITRIPVNLTYTFKNNGTIEIWGSNDILTTKIADDGIQYKNFIQSVGLRGNKTAFKKLNISSSIRLNRNTGTGLPTQVISIWNISLGYRFSKSQSYELKLSANDILNQNKGIINNVNGNVVNFGEVNRLQQYFMLNFAYYPRKFGLNFGK